MSKFHIFFAGLFLNSLLVNARWGENDSRTDMRNNAGLQGDASGPCKMAVGGGILAEVVTVKFQANWPDYVFQKNYPLWSLTEVRDFISQNQHLPEIPSAQEIALKGLDLGDMNKLLLKKVGELTLYLLEKDREVKSQKESLNLMQE